MKDLRIFGITKELSLPRDETRKRFSSRTRQEETGVGRSGPTFYLDAREPVWRDIQYISDVVRDLSVVVNCATVLGLGRFQC